MFFLYVCQDTRRHDPKDCNLRLDSRLIKDVAQYRPVNIHRRFRGMYCFHFQGRRISQASNQQEAGNECISYIFVNASIYLGAIGSLVG
jgi:hypothetical protein